VTPPETLPDDIAALQAALLAERVRAARVEAELAVAKAKASDDQAVIAGIGQRGQPVIEVVGPRLPYPVAVDKAVEGAQRGVAGAAQFIASASNYWPDRTAVQSSRGLITVP